MGVERLDGDRRPLVDSNHIYTYIYTMARPRLSAAQRKRLYTCYLDPDLIGALKALARETAPKIGVGEHIRRALRAYLTRHGTLTSKHR